MLEAAVAKYREKDWPAVAKHVGSGLTAEQCRKRWSCHLKFLRQGLKADLNWTEEEVRPSLEQYQEVVGSAHFFIPLFLQLSALVELVRKHTVPPYWSKQCKVMTKPRINWTSVVMNLVGCQASAEISGDFGVKEGTN